mmetsp:Transcript_23996/g.80635  ORF Transcript_23996/g.80635 Transcript_23996/m.80635 type:complete len:92 (+) Transcript_23996:46-321(+)
MFPNKKRDPYGIVEAEAQDEFIPTVKKSRSGEENTNPFQIGPPGSIAACKPGVRMQWLPCTCCSGWGRVTENGCTLECPHCAGRAWTYRAA